jgi:hypothetical protein
MNGLTVIETPIMLDLIEKVAKLSDRVEAMQNELIDKSKPYLTAQEVMEIAGFGKTWLNDNKQDIGYSMVGGCLRFKRKDLEAYMETNYFKTKQPKRNV